MTTRAFAKLISSCWRTPALTARQEDGQSVCQAVGAGVREHDAVLGLALLLLAAPALAQDALVQPSVTAAPSRVYPDTIVVTASRLGTTPVDRLGASVTVLDAQALELRQTREVSDILRDVPGVAVNRSGGVGGLTQLRLRGTEANHVLVLIDGIEVSDPYQGEFDFATLIADETARIEVLRGQQSSLYGSDAIGGVVQYLTLGGREQPGTAARLEGGSFGTVSGGARTAGVSGDLDYVLTGSAYRTAGAPNAVGGTRDLASTQAGASAKLNWNPSETFKLTATLRSSWTKADINNSDFDSDSPTFGRIVDSPGAYYTARSVFGLLRGELTWLDGKLTSALTRPDRRQPPPHLLRLRAGFRRRRPPLQGQLRQRPAPRQRPAEADRHHEPRRRAGAVPQLLAGQSVCLHRPPPHR